jgi:hypothetical protein
LALAFARSNEAFGEKSFELVAASPAEAEAGATASGLMRSSDNAAKESICLKRNKPASGRELFN